MVTKPADDDRSEGTWKWSRTLGSIKSGIDVALKLSVVVALLQAVQLVGEAPDLNTSVQTVRLIDAGKLRGEEVWQEAARQAAAGYNELLDAREQLESVTVGTSTLFFLPVEVPNDDRTPVRLAPLVYFSTELDRWVLLDEVGNARPLPEDRSLWSEEAGLGACDERVIVIDSLYGRTGCQPRDGELVALVGGSGIPLYASILLARLAAGPDAAEGTLPALEANDLRRALVALDGAFHLRSTLQINNIGDGDAEDVRIATPSISALDEDGASTFVVSEFTAVDRGTCGDTGSSAETDFRLGQESCSLQFRTETATRDQLPVAPPNFLVSASNDNPGFDVSNLAIPIVVLAIVVFLVVSVWEYRTAKPDAY